MNFKTFILFIVASFIINSNHLSQASNIGSSVIQCNENMKTIRRMENPEYNDLKILGYNGDTAAKILTNVNSNKPASDQQKNLIYSTLINNCIGVYRNQGCLTESHNNRERRQRVRLFGCYASNDKMNSVKYIGHHSALAAINIGLLYAFDRESLNDNYLNSLFFTHLDWMKNIKAHAKTLIKHLGYEKSIRKQICENILSCSEESYKRIFDKVFMKVYLDLLDTRSGYCNIVAKEEAENLQLGVMYSQHINKFKTSDYIKQRVEISQPDVIEYKNSTHTVHKNIESTQRINGEILFKINLSEDLNYTFTKLKPTESSTINIKNNLAPNTIEKKIVPVNENNFLNTKTEIKKTKRTIEFGHFEILVNLSENVKDEDFVTLLDKLRNMLQNDKELYDSIKNIQACGYEERKQIIQEIYLSKLESLINKFEYSPKDKLIKVFKALIEHELNLNTQATPASSTQIVNWNQQEVKAQSNNNYEKFIEDKNRQSYTTFGTDQANYEIWPYFIRKNIQVLERAGAQVYESPPTGDCGLFILGKSRQEIQNNAEDIKNFTESFNFDSFNIYEEDIRYKLDNILDKNYHNQHEVVDQFLLTILGLYYKTNIIFYTEYLSGTLQLYEDDYIQNNMQNPNFYKPENETIFIYSPTVGHYRFLIPNTNRPQDNLRRLIAQNIDKKYTDYYKEHGELNIGELLVKENKEKYIEFANEYFAIHNKARGEADLERSQLNSSSENKVEANVISDNPVETIVKLILEADVINSDLNNLMKQLIDMGFDEQHIQEAYKRVFE